MVRVSLALFLLLFVTLSGVADVGLATFDFNELETLRAKAAHLKLPSTDWRSLQAKQIVARPLTGSQTKELAGFGAVLAEAGPPEFIEAFSTLAVFKRSETTLACGRFSAQPVLDDLADLTLSDKDLYALMRAQPGAAEIKLAEADFARLRASAGPTPIFTTKLKSKLAAEYKQILLAKARAYLAEGGVALGAYADQAEAINGHSALTDLLRFQVSAASYNPQFSALLAGAPHHGAPADESFLYWALQKFGKLKPVISLVHVLIHRDGERVFVASKQIYASHYTEAGLGIAELITVNEASGRPRTLAAYTIRLQVDLLGGSLGFMKKRMAQPHLLETLKTSLQGLRTTVETLHSEKLAKQSN